MCILCREEGIGCKQKAKDVHDDQVSEWSCTTGYLQRFLVLLLAVSWCTSLLEIGILS